MLLVKHIHTLMADCLLQVCIEFIYRGQKKIDYTNGLAQIKLYTAATLLEVDYFFSPMHTLKYSWPVL